MFCLPLLHLPFTLQAYFNELKAEQSSPEFHLASVAQEIAQCRAANTGWPCCCQSPAPEGHSHGWSKLCSHPRCLWGGSNPVPLSFFADTEPRWEVSPWCSGVKEVFPTRNGDGLSLCCLRGARSALSGWMQILHGSKTFSCGMKYPGKISASYLHLPPLAGSYLL